MHGIEKGKCMHSFQIQLDARNDLITIKFSGTVLYKTLLESLAEMVALNMPERVHVVLDFSEVKGFFIRYRHIINFRHALKALLPETASKIAIINAPESSLDGPICSSTPLIESDFKKMDLRCFGTHQISVAYRWVE